MSMKDIIVNLVRRGPRELIVSYPKMGWGNHLFQLMQVHCRRADNPETYLIRPPRMEAWFEEFPLLADLVIPESDRRFTDRIALTLGFGFGEDFTREQLDAFCQQTMLSSSTFQRRIDAVEEEITAATLVINVRRGDYYGTAFEPEFGMRIVPYVDEAVALQECQTAFDSIQFVSDDLAWCSHHFQHLATRYPVSFTRAGNDMIDDLATLSAARQMILGNSTFSYWGAYLAASRGALPQSIVAPGFHQRTFTERAQKPPFHDPLWTVIDEIPGGWQEESGHSSAEH